MLHRILAAGALACALPLAALAQQAPAPSMLSGIPEFLRPATGVLLEGAATIVILVIGFYAKKLLGEMADEKLRNRIDEITRNGVKMAEAKIGEVLGPNTPTDKKSEMAAEAARYVVDAAPALLKKLGVDITGQQIPDKALAEVEKAAQTPTPTATVGVTLDQKPAT